MIGNETAESADDIKISLDVGEYYNEVYVETFITRAESYKIKHFKSIYKNMKSSSLPLKYKLFLLHLSIKNYEDHPANYIKLITVLIGEYDARADVLSFSRALRLIFLIPLYFKSLSEIIFYKFIDRIIKWATMEEETIATHASKCLQLIFCNNDFIKWKRIDLLRKLGEFTLFRLITLHDCSILKELSSSYEKETKSLNQSIINDDAQLSKNGNQCVCQDESFEDICAIPIIEPSFQQFHYMILLNYIIPGLINCNFINNVKFMNLLNSIIIKKCSTEAIYLLAISIIDQCASNAEFRYDFYLMNGIFLICSKIQSSDSSTLVFSILRKITNDQGLMRIICNNDFLVKEMMNYTCRYYKVNVIVDILQILLNAFLYNQFFDYFVKYNGIYYVLKSILSLNGFTFRIMGGFSKNHLKCEDNDSIPIIILSVRLLSVYLTLLVHSVDCSSLKDSLNFSSIESLLATSLVYFQKMEKFGGIRENLIFFQEMLTEIFSKWLLYVFRSFCMKRLKSKTAIFSNDFLTLLYILSLYYKSHSIFITSFSDPSFGIEFGVSFIDAFKYTFIKCINSGIAIQKTLIQIYNNLLMFCFPSRETYLHYLNGELPNASQNIKLGLFFESLIKSDIIYYLMIFIKLNTSIPYPLITRTVCVKCLFLLSYNDRVCQIISENWQFLTHEIFQTITSYEFTDIERCQYHSFLKFSSFLVRRINIKNKKCYKLMCHDSMKNSYLSSIRIDQNKILSKTDTNLNNSDVKVKKLKLQMFDQIETDFTIQRYSEYRDYLLNVPHTALEMKKNIGLQVTIHENSYITLFSNRNNCNTYKIRKSIYNQIHNSNCVVNSILFTLNDTDLPVIKFSFDGKILASVENGIRAYQPKLDKSVLYSSPLLINHIMQSNNGQLLLAGGSDNEALICTYIWKYNSENQKKNNTFISKFPATSHSIFSRTDRSIFGVDTDQKISLIDIETQKNISEYNADQHMFYLKSTLEVNDDENLLYFNGDLFCIRSGKLITSFERFNSIVSGIFMPLDLEILINSELWDLRTFKLSTIINEFHETSLKRNHNDDILAAYSISEETKSHTRVVECLHSWFFGSELPGNSLSFYETKHFSILAKEILFPKDIFTYDVSLDGRKFITLKDSDSSPTILRVHELGYPICKKSDVEEYYTCDLFTSDSSVENIDSSEHTITSFDDINEYIIEIDSE